MKRHEGEPGEKKKIKKDRREMKKLRNKKK